MSACDKLELGDIKEYVRCNLRHEIIHAFLSESGLQNNWEHKDYGHEETTIDWFAIQFYKIAGAIRDAEELIENHDDEKSTQGAYKKFMDMMDNTYMSEINSLTQEKNL